MVESKSSNMISIEDAAVINTEMRMIRKILDGMKPRDRICLLLKYSGYTYNEIADMLEIKRTSISQILSRAQKKIHEKIQ